MNLKWMVLASICLVSLGCRKSEPRQAPTTSIIPASCSHAIANYGGATTAGLVTVPIHIDRNDPMDILQVSLHHQADDKWIAATVCSLYSRPTPCPGSNSVDALIAVTATELQINAALTAGFDQYAASEAICQ